jgi:hypothetical protein
MEEGNGMDLSSQVVQDKVKNNPTIPNDDTRRPVLPVLTLILGIIAMASVLPAAVYDDFFGYLPCSVLTMLVLGGMVLVYGTLAIIFGSISIMNKAIGWMQVTGVVLGGGALLLWALSRLVF